MKAKRHALDVVFIHAEAGIAPIGALSCIPPLGLIQLACFLNGKGFRCRVVDTRHPHFTVGGFGDYLRAFRPRFIGFTVLTDTVSTVGRLIDAARRASPDSRILVGGAHATVCDEEVLHSSEPDVVVRGEGELPILALLQGKRPGDTSGCTFRRGRKAVRTPRGPFIDIDSLPTPDVAVVEGWEEMPYQPAVLTGRGCPYRCAFCASAVLSPRVRWRGIPRVIEDIALVRRRISTGILTIADDTFTVSEARTAEFSRAVRRIGGGSDFYWYCEGRVDRLGRRPDLVRQMREAGLIFLQMGIESGDERVLAAYRKKISLDDARALVATCRDERVLTHAGFIVGGAFESPETIARTRAVALELIERGGGMLQTMFAFYTPFPGTEMALHPGRYGLRLLDPELLTSVAFDNCVAETESFSRADLFREYRGLYAVAYEAIADQGRRRGAELDRYLEEIVRKTSLDHRAIGAHRLPDPQTLIQEKLRNLFSRAEGMSQFLFTAGKKWGDLIPTRMPVWHIGSDGRYGSDLSGKGLPPLESGIIHYASGKHTGRTIAKLLGKRIGELSPALASLEKKKMIFYRTF